MVTQAFDAMVWYIPISIKVKLQCKMQVEGDSVHNFMPSAVLGPDLKNLLCISSLCSSMKSRISMADEHWRGQRGFCSHNPLKSGI